MTTKNIKRHDFSSIFDTLKHCKFKLILLGVICVVMLFTGIIVGIKTSGSCDEIVIFDLFTFGSSFWGRLLSMVLVTAICFGCSFSKWLFPVALLFLSYRGYLLGLNLTLIIIFNGVTGIIAAILVIFPCQLLALAIMTLMYILLCKKRDNCRGIKENLVLLVIALVLLIAICVLETIMFALFSPNIILIV